MNRETLRRIVPFVLLTVVFAALLYRAEHKAETGISDINQRVTKIESPCLKSAEEPTAKNKRLCRESFEKAIGTITHPEACAVERKAGTLKALRELARHLDVNFKEPCKGARLAQELERSNERDQSATAVATPSDGGDATSSPSTGHSQPAPGNGGSHGTTSHHHAPSVPGEQGGGEGVPPPAPTKESSSTSSQSSSSTVERTESTVVESAPVPVPEAVGGVIEGVGKTVEGTGAAVNGTVEGVTEATCSLAKVLCP